MGASSDHESRTEEPTERKITDSLDKGNVPFSREPLTLGTLLAALLVLHLVIEQSAARLTAALMGVIENLWQIRLGTYADSVALLADVLTVSALCAFPALAVIACGGVFAALVQNVPQASIERITPKWSRVTPMAGWARLTGTEALMEFLKTAGKAAAVLFAGYIVVRSELPSLASAANVDPSTAPGVLLRTVIKLVTAVSAVSVVLALADVAWSRVRWRRNLRMTRDELKQEFKQSEGDPAIKAKVRSIARQRASKKMFAKLPSATMVITNPTHFAVALRYTRAEGGAPVVIAKGLDFLAQRIREVASAHNIPLVENKPLARSLYETVEVGDAIPAEFYKAIAEIIHFLEMRKLYPRYASVGHIPL